jgi:hypothetical protein
MGERYYDDINDATTQLRTFESDVGLELMVECSLQFFDRAGIRTA